MTTWRQTRLKFLSSVPITNGVGERGEYEDRGWPRYIRTTDISGPRSLRPDTFKSLPPVTARKAEVRKGDLLMTAAGATVGKSLLYLSDEPACYAGYLVRFRARPNIDPRFIAYWTESRAYWQQIDVGAVKATIENFSAGKYRNLRLSVPSLDEQQAIVEFLDRETTRIDALISKKRVLAARLSERFQGLLMNEIFSDDQRSWVSLRRLVNLLPGLSFSSSDFLQDPERNVRLLRGINISPGEIRWSDVMHVSPKVAKTALQFTLSAGDIVIGMDRPVIGGGMRVAMLDDNDVPSLLVQRVARIRARDGTDQDYVRYALQSDAFVAYFSPITTGVSVPHISPEQILSFRVPSRSGDEQADIAERLRNVERGIRRVTRLLEEQVGLLQERRQALITAAVTGQLNLSKAA